MSMQAALSLPDTAHQDERNEHLDDWDKAAEEQARGAYAERMGMNRPLAERLAETRRYAAMAGTLQRR